MLSLLYFINIDRVRTKTKTPTTAATTIIATTPPLSCTSTACTLSTTVLPASGTIYYVTTYGGSFYITGNTTVNTLIGSTTLSTTCAGYCAYAASNFGIANTCGVSTISDGTNCINSAGTISIGSASAISAIGPGSGDPIPIIFAGIPPGHIFNLPAISTSNACTDNPGYYCCCDTGSG
jgi:hypothetical protein